MDFGANKTPIEAIKEGLFEGTYFRYIYCGVNVNGTKSNGKNLITWKTLIKIFIV